MANPTKCAVPGCNNVVTQRGLCQECFAVVGKMVMNKETTWDVIESKGHLNLKKTAAEKQATKTWVLS